MKELKTGKLLWETIEKAAREKNNVDLGHPDNLELGECEYRINNEKTNQFRRGFVMYNPYV